MKKTLLLSVTASAMLMAGGDIAPAAPVEAAPAPSSEFLIFNNIYAKGEIRPRYEFVDASDNGRSDASAFTNRLLLGVGADFLQVDGLSVYLEGVNVAGFGDYDDVSITDPRNYQVVADPSQSRVTQAYMDYKFGDTLIRAGRQGVNLDNQRFIGTVNWRQMPQTYDAVAVVNNSVENLNLLAAYVWRVNRVFDTDTRNPLGNSFETGSVLLHGQYHFMPELTLTAYDYMLEDFYDTYGIAATGKIDAGFGKVSYRLEYAHQGDPTFEHKANNVTADADYYNVQAGLNVDGILVGAQYEVLGAGDGGNGSFQTPLATGHKFNGWADMFLTTPANGLVDVNGMVGYKAKGFGIAKVIYHDFSSDKGSTDYGTEVDVLYKNKIPGVKGLTGLLKGAWYSADNYGVDTTKFWVMLDYKFDTK